MQRILVITHRADFDGIFSQAIARLYFDGHNKRQEARGKLPRYDVHYVGWDYGDPVPPVIGFQSIFMIDISVPELMQTPGLVWIDHHESAIADYPSSIAGYRIDGVAACRLAWQYFLGLRRLDHEENQTIELPELQAYIDRQVDEPWAVRLAGEYDIWDKRDPSAETFQHGLRSAESLDFALLLGDDRESVGYVGELLQRGQLLQQAKQRENASIAKHQSFTIQWEGLTFIACNAARFNSLLFTAALEPRHDACLGFCWDGGKGRWKVSLYGVPGRPEIVLNTIAKKYGGGGHRQACGFECETLPFVLGKREEAA